MAKPKIAIIVGTTRPGRFSEIPAAWIAELAAKRPEIEVEVLDLRDYPMPLFDEAGAPAWAPTQNEVALRWQQKVAEADGFIAVTGEYNRGPAAVLKNAFDYAYKEWNRKPIAFVGYGGTGGARAIEQLRLNAIEMQMAPIRVGVHIQAPVYMAVRNEGKTLDSFDFLQQSAGDLLDQLIWWAYVLKAAREDQRAVPLLTPTPHTIPDIEVEAAA
ncbi:MAG: NAD(P)H-dependent oxidoreductase [Bauldia sp.]|nr:NAD(P)H-dependent oxidoreductase [Bauldia sp.]